MDEDHTEADAHPPDDNDDDWSAVTAEAASAGLSVEEYVATVI